MRKQNDIEDKEARDNLMLAASRVVGRKGYKGASVARIAEEAGISIGHCYKYFPSRDAILENLILWVLEKFEEFSEKNLSKAKNYIEFEHEALNQYFKFQKKYPFFITILRDSEVETPTTWQEFTERRFVRYVEALSAAFDRDELKGFKREQIPHISRMLSAMRRTIVFGYSEKTPDREEAIKVYDIFVRQALLRQV